VLAAELRGRMPCKAGWSEETGRFPGEAGLRAEPGASGALVELRGRMPCKAGWSEATGKNREISRRGRLACRAGCFRSTCGAQRENAMQSGVERSDRQRPGDFPARPACVPSRVLQEQLWSSEGECHAKRGGAKRQAETGRFPGEAGLRAEPGASGARVKLRGRMPCKAGWSEATE